MNKNGHKPNEANHSSKQDGFDTNAKQAETNLQVAHVMPTDRRYLHLGEGGPVAMTYYDANKS